MPRFILLLFALFAAVPAYAQDRTVVEHDGTRTLIVETWVPAPPAAIWPAISTAEGWKSWAVPGAWLVGDLLETSYDPAAKPGDAANIQQRFVAALPGRILVFRTVRTPPGFPHARAFMGVTQFFELIPEGEGVRVRLSGTGYPAGAEGDALLGFFGTGNRTTLNALAARFGLAPLDFLPGHCWKGLLPNGDANTHCFTRDGATVLDRHEVLRAGKRIYGGETRYGWDSQARAIGFTYGGEGGTGGKGNVRPAGQDLDFGSTDYATGSGTVTVATRWVRVAPDAYEARDTSRDARFTRTVRYTRVD